MRYCLKLSGPLSLTITVLYIIITIPTSSSQQNNEQVRQCSSPFNCGNITRLPYPFWGHGRPQYCGLQGFEVQCPNNPHDKPLIDISSREFRVLDIHANNSLMRIARTDMFDVCSYDNLTNTTLDHTFFDYFNASNHMLNLLFNCSQVSSRAWGNLLFTCSGQRDPNYFVDDDQLLSNLGEVPSCAAAVNVPVLQSEFIKLIGRQGEMQDAVNEGFYVQYQHYQDDCRECMESGGICGSDREGLQFSCLCQDRPYSRVCGNNEGVASNRKQKQMIIVGVSAGVGGILFCILLFIFIFLKMRKKYNPFLSSNDISTELCKSDTKKESSKGLHIFSYDELEKATDNFDQSNELGDGGFGTVYYGVLQDGRAVAVKKLYENNRRVVGQFMNEVEILAGLSHRNLVTLYGSTSSDSGQLLLVFEYIANGTVADHLYGEKAKNSALRWTTRLKIAVETAGALVYLHASDVIHRDVKSNNILLDSNFCVKVADFGLSRLVPFDVSHVSTLPQGTPGYLDPEYHQLCQLTEKSDVYSFGVVLVELISSKPPVDMTRPLHEVSLANFAIKNISENKLHQLVDQNIGYESDQKVKRMIHAVAELAFRCLQNGRDMRPTMAEVLDALKRIQREGQVQDSKENEQSNNYSDDSDKWTDASITPNIGR